MNASTLKILLAASLFFLINQGIEYLSLTREHQGMQALCQWDCKWYGEIADHGYDTAPKFSDFAGSEKGDMANWAFFPALPLLIKLAKSLFNEPTSLLQIIISKTLFLLSTVAFTFWASSKKFQLNPYVCAMVIALNPYAIYGNVGYTEPLFLLLSCLFFIFLEKESFFATAVLGIALGATRLPGIACSPAMAMSTPWRSRFLDPDERARALLCVLLPPVGLATFMLFLHWKVGDALAFKHIQLAWGREATNPIKSIVWAISGISGGWAERVSGLVSCLALAATVFFLVKREMSMFVFCLICTMLPLFTGVWAMPRYTWWQAPVLLLVSQFLSGRRIAQMAFLATGVIAEPILLHLWLHGGGYVV